MLYAVKGKKKREESGLVVIDGVSHRVVVDFLWSDRVEVLPVKGPIVLVEVYLIVAGDEISRPDELGAVVLVGVDLWLAEVVVVVGLAELLVSELNSFLPDLVGRLNALEGDDVVPAEELPERLMMTPLPILASITIQSSMVSLYHATMATCIQ